MSRKVSCTATVGKGSEKHNHDLEYRETLQHVHGTSEDVIELIPYRPYQEQINEMMKPYIDEYNEKQQARYQAAWERYNSGQIKTKPRKRDYQPMGYDYYTEHLNDVFFNRATKENETVKMWREVIFGLGDQSDRENGLITREEAVAVMKGVVERWPELFPDFKLLGATIHLDEEGFYHCHIDYKPMFEVEKELKQEQGLRVSVGQDAALEHMGFEPEQSVINGRDKAPIRFNAFRNRLYHETELELNKHGLRLWYGASNEKEPEKDSSTNQRMENWQATQDGINQLQQMKNTMLDIVEGDRVSPEGYKAAVTAAKNIEDTLTQIGAQKRSRLNRDNVIVHFSLFDQLRSFVKSMMDTISHLLQKVDILRENLDKECEYTAELEAEVKRLQPFEKEAYKQRVELREARDSRDRYRRQAEKQAEFMGKYKIGDKSLDEVFEQEQQRQKNHSLTR